MVKTLLKSCAFCDGNDVDLIMDFGEMALAGGFLKKEEFKNEKKFKMRMGFCNSCCAVQIVDSITPDLMFKDYFYFSSSIQTLRKHFNESSIKYFPKQKTVLNKCYWTVCRESSINFFIVSNPRSKGVEKAALWFSAAIFT